VATAAGIDEKVTSTIVVQASDKANGVIVFWSILEFMPQLK